MERTAIILGALISLVPPGGDALAASEQTLNAPPIVIQGGTTEQIETVESVLDRFETTGLDLPPLSVYIHDTKSGCDGHSGLYSPRSQIDRIDICTDAAFIVLHEFAHAWEHRFGKDVARQRLLDQSGLDAWTGADVGYRQRGEEVAANLVAWGLIARPLTASETRANRETLERFEALTGFPSPRTTD
jgi:hypothetical protein